MWAESQASGGGPSPFGHPQLRPAHDSPPRSLQARAFLMSIPFRRRILSAARGRPKLVFSIAVGG